MLQVQEHFHWVLKHDFKKKGERYETFTAYYANGTSYVGTRKSMMPLSAQQPNKKTQLISRTGNVTVSTS